MKQVLVLSQEIIVVEVIEQFFKQKKYQGDFEVINVETEWEALKRIEENEEVVAVFYDNQLESMTGIEFSLLIEGKLKKRVKKMSFFQEVVFFATEKEQSHFISNYQHLILNKKADLVHFPFAKEKVFDELSQMKMFNVIY